MAETLHFQGYAPIPVGHRVEITWFEQETTRLFGGNTRERFEHPMVRDLETGIVYQTTRMVSDTRAVYHDRVEYPLEPLLDAGETRIAKVTGCRVLSAPVVDATVLVTTLVIEELPETDAYR